MTSGCVGAKRVQKKKKHVPCENPHQKSGKCIDPKCTALGNTTRVESTTDRSCTVSASFSSDDINVIQKVFGDSESDSESNSESDRGSDSEIDHESDNKYDFVHLNQLKKRKERNMCFMGLVRL